MQRICNNLEAHSICPHYAKQRICPSLFTNHQCPATYHPEFILILRDGNIYWMPRTWICRALQRHIASDAHTHCPITDCPYSHAGNWAAADQLAFRALALRTQSYNLGLLWYEQPADSGCHPLYNMSSPSALRILQVQPFITPEQWSNHRYNKDIPSPPTYGPEFQRTQTHRRSSTTPRRPRSVTPVRREHHNRPQNLVPDEPRSYTAPVRTQEPSSSHRTHSANRSKIGAVAAHKAAPPPPPQHYIPPTESLTQRHFHGHDPWAEEVEEVDSDGLELPPPELTFDRPLPRPQTTQSVDFQLLPQLRTLVNTQNYQPVAITGSDQSYFVGEIPQIYMRHLYPTSPGEVSLNNPRRTSWQLPSDILHQLNRANIQHPTNPTQRSITPWGLFTRMQMHNAAGHFTQSEQALTIPFATQTASPELAIIQWLVHQRNNT